MSRKTVINLIIAAILIASIAGLWSVTSYYAHLPERLSQHETIVLGQNRFAPGSQGALRVLVRDSKDSSPLAGADIKVSLKPADGSPAVVLFQGQTDRQGTANVSFKVPADAKASQNLLVETKSSLGSDSLERPVTIERDYRVLLTSDKPIYQPGQAIHLRALALSAFDMTPAAAQPLEIIIADGKGNKVFRQKLTTTKFGVASADFQLASEVNTGAYKISAVLGNTSSEKTVTVEHYVLPKFAVKIETERPYYQPGQGVHGTLKANYFFGKPVTEGKVTLEGYTFDVQRSSVFSLQGATDAEGNYTFDFDLPAYIAGSDLEGGQARFYLQASVIDQAQHAETSNMSLPVAGSPLVIEAMPEGGRFRPGVENILYVLTSTPDGSPAEATVAVTFSDSGASKSASTGAYGLAEIRYTPQSLYQQITIQARDKTGQSASRSFQFNPQEYPEESILLRPDKPVYKVGETIGLTLLTSQPNGTAYLDIVREGQTVSTRSVEIAGGHAEVAVDLTPDLYGTLELHAYKVMSSGSIVRDTRLVVVDNAAGLTLTMTPGQDTYRPGDKGTLEVLVQGSDGKGAQSAIGLAIVDESVFALAEQDPGFAKLYFLLEKELLQPKYDLHGYSVSSLVSGLPGNDPDLQNAVQDAAQASLAAAAPKNVSFSLQANSHYDAVQRANQRKQVYFAGLVKGLYVLFLILPLAVLGLSVFAVRKEGHLSSSIALTLGLLVVLLLAFFLWPLGDNYSWAQSPIDRLSVMVQFLSYQAETALLIFGLCALAGLITLIVWAIVKKDRPLGWSLALIAIFLANLFLLAFVAMQGVPAPGDAVIAWGLFALALFPLAFLLRFSGFLWSKRILPALAILPLALFLLIGTLPALGSGMNRSPMLKGAVEDGVMLQNGPVWGEAALPAMAVPAPMATQAASKEMESPQTGAGQTNAAEPPRLRQFFPETMLWLPDAVTDESGRASLDIPIADSITTWRMTALASTQDGRLGSATGPLRVFQDFFIDLDLPQSLTVGDEVSVPVGVYNYMTSDQAVKLELAQQDWFELLDQPVKEMTIAANDISVVYFKVRAVKFGSQPFKVTAWGSQMSDAIQKEVTVFPNGKEMRFSQSDRLLPGKTINQTINIPAEAVPGTQRLTVKIYPGIVSQVVEGLDSILRMPNGCFEQTSSTTYPNVLVLDYLKTTSQTSPEVQLKAEEYINLGYQRLTTFEVQSSGGFSLFGEVPADRMLTAYGLQEFSDMGRVHDVDPALVKRAAEWLLSQQTGDGSWENDRGLVHENTWSSLGNDRLPVTAYIAWSLSEAGFGSDPRTQKGLRYVRDNQAGANDAYVLALVANALVASDLSAEGKITTATSEALDRLAGMAQQDGDGAFWQSGVATFMGAEGQTGSIETTAMAALAFLKSGSHPDLGNAALTYIIRQKDSFGTWHSTQATVLSLKALIQSVKAGAEKVNATAVIALNGAQQRSVQVTKDNFDVVQMVTFDDINIGRDNAVAINVSGEGNLMYQVSGSYYLPWDQLAKYPQLAPPEDLVTIKVAYDRTKLAVNDTVNVAVSVALNEQGGRADSALVDLGLPPGFSVQSEDLDALVAHYKDVPQDYAFPTIKRYELTGRQILVYIGNLSEGKPLEFSYRLRAKYPLSAQTPSSSAYDYYNPGVSGETPPQQLVVAE